MSEPPFTAPLAPESPWPKSRYDEAQTGHARVPPRRDETRGRGCFLPSTRVDASGAAQVTPTVHVSTSSRRC